MKNIYFFSLDEVFNIHQLLLQLYGGEYGVRDNNLLESAINQPAVEFSGNFLHKSLFEMAAAYMYHLIKNHPFLDGNKRVGLFCAILFLEYNIGKININKNELYHLSVQVAKSQTTKQQIAAFFENKYNIIKK